MDPAMATISDFFGRACRGWWLYFVEPLLAMPAAAFLYNGTARRVYCAKLFHYNHRRCIFRCEFPASLAERTEARTLTRSNEAHPDRFYSATAPCRATVILTEVNDVPWYSRRARMLSDTLPQLNIQLGYFLI
jgi:hypothetical protein